ncbi:GerMN domain-containing protein [Paenibacillus tarimensis]
MKINRNICRAGIAGALALSLLMTAGCGIFSEETSREIDPPQIRYEDGLEDSADEQTMEQGQQSQITVYLKDRHGYIAPVTLLTTQEEEKKSEQLALEMMIDGGAYSDLLPEGFQPVLPKGTEIRTLNIVKDQQLAIVDLSEAFADYNIQDERRIVEAVTWTLTGFPEIERVQLWHEGEELKEMPVDGFPLQDPLTRHIGINLEAAKGIDIGRSMAVTLYFSAITPDELQYYVPVTRLINRQEDVAKRAMEQLIAGPMPMTPLVGVMTGDLEVKNVAVQDDLVTVDLYDESYKSGQQMPAEMLQSVILSITENTGAEKVQIQLNGATDVTDTNNRSYSEPVVRPSNVNAIKS